MGGQEGHGDHGLQSLNIIRLSFLAIIHKVNLCIWNGCTKFQPCDLVENRVTSRLLKRVHEVRVGRAPVIVPVAVSP
ncbi:hypothetical protein EVAR_79215_1 [Eumeta japonica]|uniref:Uncharacterized protein n=1 Tax=Eumeta variegata TaxID=151549 RepID=A0A4C1UUK5_EUMVA|nr:hypothetical protein EVAR_79215_1 [Eumeta japonica]